ncbi:MAG TPA: hypothetical protein VKZ83_02960 [Phototrophicaceae bacterium]|nr:hypothetical protein [Phototrophicaceae bacterium]
MTTDGGRAPDVEDRPHRRSVGDGVRAAIASLLVAGWLAAPLVLYASLITAAPFFGELPTEAERAEASRLAVVGVALAFLAPLAAALLVRGRHPLRVVALIQLGLSLLATFAILVAAALN